MDIDDETLSGEDISLESLTQELDAKIEESTNIRDLIQKEKSRLRISLEDVKNEIKIFFTKMIKELEEKVDEVDEKLKLFLKKYCKEINISKEISKEAKEYKNEENNNIKLLSYISKLNKACEKMNNLMSEQIYGLKYTFDINNKEIVYEEPKINNINKNYSFLCLNKINLNSFITKGTENTQIEITLNNNGKINWPSNAKLVFDNNSHIKSDDIILNPQRCNEEKTYKINFNDLSKLNIGKYEAYLWFNINGENFGDKMQLMIKVDEDENSCKIDLFRESYSLSRNDYSDEQLKEFLKKADNDIELAFSYLFEEQ